MLAANAGRRRCWPPPWRLGRRRGPAAARAGHGGRARARIPDAATLYRDAMATTHSWSVHYASASTQSKHTLVESGDAGPASGSQTVGDGQRGSISIIVIGGITYVKGNAGGLENAGRAELRPRRPRRRSSGSSSRPTTRRSPGRGRRPLEDIAQELALKGPLSLERPRTSTGRGRRHRGDAEIRAQVRATSSSTSAPTVPTCPWRRTR